MKYGYYPGCSLHATAYEYDKSFRAVCGKLGVELAEVEDWVCCGTTPAHSTSHLLATALPAHSLAKAKKASLDEVLVPCASCFQRLKVASTDLEESDTLRKDVAKVLEAEFPGGVKVSHPLEQLLRDVGPDAIKKAVSKPLKGLTTVCYYGCLLTRPPKVMKFDDAERPVKMEELLKLCGAKTIDWSFKTECCGASFALTQTDIVLDLTNKLLSNAKAVKLKVGKNEVRADAVVVACPLCHANLDMRQGEIASKYGTDHDIPILYFTQVLGLALGVPPEELSFKGHIVDPVPMLKEKGLI